MQAQGGAKNPIIVLPDAELDLTAKIVADSVYGCAGQRCLAASIVIRVGDEKNTVKEAIVETVKAKTVGYGLNEGSVWDL